MSTSQNPVPETFALRLTVVQSAILALQSQRIHPFFIAYLQIRKQSVLQETRVGIEPHWDELGDLLRVAGGPPNKPFYRPFGTTPDRASNQFWLNKNIAGSYAPSSLRKTPYKVITTDEDSRFGLLDNDAELARETFLYGERVNAIALAVFLFRDFGFVGDDGQFPQVEDLPELLKGAFLFSDEDPDFDTLFDSTVPEETSDWFEPWSDDLAGTDA